MQTELIVLLIGALSGVTRSVLGYSNQSSSLEDFDWRKMIKSIFRAAIGGGIATWGIFDFTVDPTLKMFISTFIMGMGSDVIMKELYTSGTKAKEKLKDRIILPILFACILVVSMTGVSDAFVRSLSGDIGGTLQLDKKVSNGCFKSGTTSKTLTIKVNGATADVDITIKEGPFGTVARVIPVLKTATATETASPACTSTADTYCRKIVMTHTTSSMEFSKTENSGTLVDLLLRCD